MLISEIYRSRQGEGALTGTPSVFVRTSGCNLRCSFCDTPFASWDPVGDSMSVEQIVDKIESLCDPDFESDFQKIEHVVLTGGEPMLPRSIVPLCQRLQQLGFFITIETAGTIFRSPACDLMSISPKFANSTPSLSRAGEWQAKHEANRYQPGTVKKLLKQYDCQLKFVVDQPADLDEILAYLSIVTPDQRKQVMLMPQGVELDQLTEKETWLRPICEKHGFTFCPRRHIQWYGNTRGT